MIFADKVSPLQYVMHRRDWSFIEWVSDKLEILFLPKRDPNYPLKDIFYVLMKRLHLSYTEIMLMDSETRDSFFYTELEVIEKENKQ